MSDTELLLKSEAPRRLEVFTGAGRRRSWTTEQKAQIVAECDEAGASVSAVARRHGLTPQQLSAPGAVLHDVAHQVRSYPASKKPS
jgi:transposase